MESTPILIRAPSGNSNINAPNATTQSTNQRESTNWRLDVDCCFGSFFIFSMTAAISLFGLGIAQMVVKLKTGESSETLEKVLNYSLGTYSIVATTFLICAAVNMPSSGSSSYGRGSSSTTDSSFYYFGSSDFSSGHHDGGASAAC